MYDNDYPSYRRKMIGEILNPIGNYLIEHRISPLFIIVAMLTIFIYITSLRNRPKDKKYTWDEILAILGWILSFILAIGTQYLMLWGGPKFQPH
jgi:uncharacterized membrane protein